MKRSRHGSWPMRLAVILKIAIPTIGLGACVSLMAEALNGGVLFASWWGIREFSWIPWVRGMGTVLLVALACAYWLYQRLPAELPLRSLSRPARPEPHAVLIILVSTPSPQCHLEDSDLVFYDRDARETHRLAVTGDLANDIEALGRMPRWNWQQQLRALALHRSRLERVYLIGSSGPAGSHAHLDMFARLVRIYCGEIPILWEPGIDFEDIEAVYRRALQHAVDAERVERGGHRQRGGYRQEEIMIDATGGLKTASIAAGLVTLHNRVKFQYVNNAGEVVAYEMIYEPSRALT